MKLTVGFIRLSKPWRNTKRGIQSFSFQTLWYVRFEDLLVVMINTLLFWLVTPCTLVDIPTFLRRFSCSEMSQCGVGCLVCDISKEHSTSVFTVTLLDCWPWRWGHCCHSDCQEIHMTWNDITAQQNWILSSKAENLEYHILEEHMACVISVEANSTLKMAVNFSTTSVSSYCRGTEMFRKI